MSRPSRRPKTSLTEADVLRNAVQDEYITTAKVLLFAAYSDATIGLAYLILLFIAIFSGNVRNSADVLTLGAVLNIMHLILPFLTLASLKSRAPLVIKSVAIFAVLALALDAVSFVYRIYAIIRCEADDPLFSDEATCNHLLVYNILTAILIGLWMVTDLFTTCAAYLRSTYREQADKRAATADSSETPLETSIFAPKSVVKQFMQGRPPSFITPAALLEKQYATPEKKLLLARVKLLALGDLFLLVPYVVVSIVSSAYATDDVLFFFFTLLSFVHFPYAASLFRSAIAYSRGTVILFRSLALVLLVLDAVSLILRTLAVLNCNTHNGTYFILSLADCENGFVYGSSIAMCVLIALFIVADFLYIYAFFSLEASIGIGLLLSAEDIDNDERRRSDSDHDSDDDDEYDDADAEPVQQQQPMTSVRVLPTGGSILRNDADVLYFRNSLRKGIASVGDASVRRQYD